MWFSIYFAKSSIILMCSSGNLLQIRDTANPTLDRDQGYLRWALGQDFFADTKAIVAEALDQVSHA